MENRYLLNNARTGLIHALIQTPTPSNISEAIVHAEGIANFVIDNAKEGRKPFDYNKSYEQALLKVVPHLSQAEQSKLLLISEALLALSI